MKDKCDDVGSGEEDEKDEEKGARELTVYPTGSHLRT